MKKTTSLALGALGLTSTAALCEYWKLSHSLRSLHRVDGDGFLYYAEYSGSYYDPVVRLPLQLIRSGGCSSFFCRAEDGEVMTCRNYDLPHRGRDGQVTGLNVVLRCAPRGKYRSLGVADAAWLSMLKLPYEKGALDDNNAPALPLSLLPWLTMDGINEKGLCLALHALDVKEGESAVRQREKGRKSTTVNELLRLGLDECADVEEFIALAESFNMHHMMKSDFHIFATDASGNACVLEWRHNALRVTRQDAVTNFIVSDDDAEDCYIKGQLKERFTLPPVTERAYRYGYGHGYARFFALAEALRDHGSAEDTLAVMNESERAALLKEVSQEFDGGDLTSCTQYSAVYHHNALALELFSMRNYSRMYRFSL